MKRILLLIAIQLFAVSTALAHGGGIDKCGGHNDRKRGTYHVHQQAKYCACHPNEKDCKKEGDSKDSKKEKNK